MIADAIKSVLYADEIVVLDTGSTDKTKSIAKSLKAKVFIKTKILSLPNGGLRELKGKHDQYFTSTQTESHFRLKMKRLPLRQNRQNIPLMLFQEETSQAEMKHGGACDLCNLFYKQILPDGRRNCTNSPASGKLGHLKNL